MDIRAQIAMVFHLDKCIGCHTCSVSCKNLWTDRKGAEYMWWNNVETRPGTGYPYRWENQEKYKGGWIRDEKNDNVRLRLGNRIKLLTTTIFYNKDLPKLDDYYEPWTYTYEDLFTASESDDQPVAKPVSMITGKLMDVTSGPNWDDDLGGSRIYALNDVNLDDLSEEEKLQLMELERVVWFYLPRICNHCVNASCVAACPSGAIYKRGEDGIVLVSQQKCRSWRLCVSGCPYKKIYFNWATGKSEKCILCYPLLESGQAPSCFHTCVGRLRYLGTVLYDADAIEETIRAPDDKIVEAQLNIIKDPFDPEVIEAAKKNGISDAMIEAAQHSPVYKFVKVWKIALPLHPEYRTLPMLFYVPPLLPVLATVRDDVYHLDGVDTENLTPLLTDLGKLRLPLKYMANLFAAGNTEIIKEVYKKLIAVREYMRHKNVGDVETDTIADILSKANLTSEVAEEIYRITALPTYDERFVIPPLAREVGIEAAIDPLTYRQQSGFGLRTEPRRGG